MRRRSSIHAILILAAASIPIGARAQSDAEDDAAPLESRESPESSEERPASGDDAGAESGDASPSRPEPDASEPDASAPDASAPGTDPHFEEARQRFRQGVALARAGNCEGALAELNASLELLERPNTLYNIAQCQETLHRYDLAIAGYRRYLDLAPADDPERGAVEATMRALERLLGTISIVSAVRAEVWLDDRVVGAAPGDVLVPGGRHVLELRAEGYLPQRQEVEVAAGRTVSLEVSLSRAEETVNIHRTTTVERPPLNIAIFATGLALTGASLGIGVGFGVQAILLADSEGERPDPRLPPDTAAVEEAAVIADVFYVTAGVFGVATLVIAFLTDFGAEERSDTAVRVVPGGLEVAF